MDAGGLDPMQHPCGHTFASLPPRTPGATVSPAPTDDSQCAPSLPTFQLQIWADSAASIAKHNDLQSDGFQSRRPFHSGNFVPDYNPRRFSEQIFDQLSLATASAGPGAMPVGQHTSPWFEAPWQNSAPASPSNRGIRTPWESPNVSTQFRRRTIAATAWDSVKPPAPGLATEGYSPTSSAALFESRAFSIAFLKESETVNEGPLSTDTSIPPHSSPFANPPHASNVAPAQSQSSSPQPYDLRGNSCDVGAELSRQEEAVSTNAASVGECVEQARHNSVESDHTLFFAKISGSACETDVLLFFTIFGKVLELKLFRCAPRYRQSCAMRSGWTVSFDVQCIFWGLLYLNIYCFHVANMNSFHGDLTDSSAEFWSLAMSFCRQCHSWYWNLYIVGTEIHTERVPLLSTCGVQPLGGLRHKDGVLVPKISTYPVILF